MIANKRTILTMLIIVMVATTATAEMITEPVDIFGKVLDPDGEPVAGATVEIVQTGQRVVTNTEGEFSFRRVFTEEVTIEFNSPAFLTAQHGPFDPHDLPEPLELRFSEVRTYEKTIVITGTRDERLLKDVPVRTEVITAEAIQQKGAITLAEVLEGSTGLRVESGCSNCNFTSLRINGLEGGYTQILMDGMNLFSPLDAVYGLEQLPTVVVERVEVVKGGGSALYGGGAVGGVVNVISKQPTETVFNGEFLTLSQDGAAGALARGYGSWVSSDTRTSMFFYGNYSLYGAYDRDGDGETEVARRELRSGGARLFRRFVNDAAELQIGYEVSLEDRRGGTDIEKRPHETLVAEEILSDRRTWSAQWTHYLSGATLYKLQASRTDSTHDSYYGTNFDPLAYGVTSNPLTSASASINHFFERHTLLIGFQFDQEDIDDTRPGYGRSLVETTRNYGVYIQDDWRVNEKLTLLGGVRLDKHSALDDNVVSPRLSLLYQPTEEVQIRGTASWGFKPPKIYDTDLHVEVAGGEPGFTVNAPDLKEERALSLSLNGNWIVTQGAWGGLRLDANLFRTRLTDTFVLDDITDTASGSGIRLFERTNGGGSEVYGLELNADLQLTGLLDIEAGWTFQRSSLDEPEPEFGFTEYFNFPEAYGYLMLRVATNSYTLSGTINYTGRMWLRHYAGVIPDDRVDRVSDFLVFDARLEVPLRGYLDGVSLVATAFNVFDSFQEDLDVGPDKHSGYVYGPRRPRTLMVGLKFAF